MILTFEQECEMAFYERSDKHLNLGDMIRRLEMASNFPLVIDEGGSPCDLHSYRGYYSDLAFSGKTDQRIMSHDFIDTLEGCLNTTLTGYKGGDFHMTEQTPLWFSEYGRLGRRVWDMFLVEEKIVICTDVSPDKWHS